MQACIPDIRYPVKVDTGNGNHTAAQRQSCREQHLGCLADKKDDDPHGGYECILDRMFFSCRCNFLSAVQGSCGPGSDLPLSAVVDPFPGLLPGHLETSGMIFLNGIVLKIGLSATVDSEEELAWIAPARFPLRFLPVIRYWSSFFQTKEEPHQKG